MTSFQIYEHLTFRPAWSIIFHIAKFVRKILIGPVTVPVMLCHPLYTAANIATLSELTGGNAILGLSRGAFYEYLSQEVEKPIRAVKESVEIIDLLFRGGGGYQGKIFSLSNSAQLKVPRFHRPRMYVGSSGPKMIQMASGLAPVSGIVVDNLWNSKSVKRIMENIRIGASRAGRKPDELEVVARPFCCVMQDGQEARKTVAKELVHYLPSLVANSPMLSEAGLEPEQIQEFLADPGGQDEVLTTLIENFSAAGTPEEVVEQTDRILREGVTHVCYGHPLGRDIEESIRLVGERIKPYFQGERGSSQIH